MKPWRQLYLPPPTLRFTVLVCVALLIGLSLTSCTNTSLRSRPTSASSPTSSQTPVVTINGFVGDWFAHASDLNITENGIAHEIVLNQWPVAGITLTFKLNDPRTKRGVLLARGTVTHVHVEHMSGASRRAPHVGDERTIKIKNGTLDEPFTGTRYCNSAQKDLGTCGA